MAHEDKHWSAKHFVLDELAGVENSSMQALNLRSWWREESLWTQNFRIPSLLLSLSALRETFRLPLLLLSSLTGINFKHIFLHLQYIKLFQASILKGLGPIWCFQWVDDPQPNLNSGHHQFISLQSPCQHGSLFGSILGGSRYSLCWTLWEKIIWNDHLAGRVPNEVWNHYNKTPSLTVMGIELSPATI